jgi:hypothetical protein
VNLSVAARAAAIQLALVVWLSLLLALLLPDDFFEDWGWLSGPLAWLGCAWLTAAILRLPGLPVLAGALLAGLPSAVAVVAGVHWLGVVIAVAALAAWCGWLVARPGRIAARRV